MFNEFPYSSKNDLNLDWIIAKIKQMEKIIGGAVSDVAQFLSKKGGKMEGAIDMQGNRIFNAPTPAVESDVATKKYVDDHSGGNYLPLTGGAMTGAVNMGGNKITSVATPTADTDVATKKYVDDHGGGGGVGGDYLPLSGGTMSGAINMGGNKITSVATPEADTDVATKKYVDDHGISASVGQFSVEFMTCVYASGASSINFYIPLPFVYKNFSDLVVETATATVKDGTNTSYGQSITWLSRSNTNVLAGRIDGSFSTNKIYGITISSFKIQKNS